MNQTERAELVQTLRLRRRAQLNPPQNLQQLLAALDDAGGAEGEVSVAQMIDAVGCRSFGPLLLLCGVVAVSPLSGIPGVPTTIAVVVLLIASQLLLRRPRFWMPQWILRRRIGQQKLHKVLRFMTPPARYIDRFVHPRLQALTGATATRVVAGICVLIALAMPPLELLPFANHASGAALTLLGVALIAQDGLLVLLGMAACGGGVAAGYVLLQ